LKAFLTTTTLRAAVSLSVIVVRCEGRPNHHNNTYSGIAVIYYIAVLGPSYPPHHYVQLYRCQLL